MYKQSSMIQSFLSHFPKSSRKQLLLSSITKYRWNTTTTTLRLHSSSSEKDETTSYLHSLGYSDPAIQEGMTDALKGVFGNRITASNLKSIGKPGKLWNQTAIIFLPTHFVPLLIFCHVIWNE